MLEEGQVPSYGPFKILFATHHQLHCLGSIAALTNVILETDGSLCWVCVWAVVALEAPLTLPGEDGAVAA